MSPPGRAPPNKIYIEREVLRKLYVDDNLSTEQISKELLISRVTLNRLLKEMKLSRRIEGLND